MEDLNTKKILLDVIESSLFDKNLEEKTRNMMGQMLISVGTEFVRMGTQMLEKHEQKPQPDDAITSHYLQAVGNTEDLFGGDDIYIPGETQSQKAYDENEKY